MHNHFIFTNFGVGIKDNNWLSYRVEMLINITANSIFSQTEKDFNWIIFIDKELPKIYKKKLKQLEDKADQKKLIVVICEVNNYVDIQSTINSYINLIEKNTNIVTTRIDDDDALHITAIAEIKLEAIKSINLGNNLSLIELENGYEWLPIEMIARRVNHETIALGLTLVSNHDNKIKSITQLAHHTALVSLRLIQPNVYHKKIRIECGCYLYTKHQLSDSYFIGHKARILQDSSSFNIVKLELSEFGINNEIIDYIGNALQDAPSGMPHKYMGKLNELRKKREILQKDGVTNLDLIKLNSEINWIQNNATRKNISNLKRKIKIAIIGSISTMNLFNLRAELGQKFEIVLYLSDRSVLSLSSPPFIYNYIKQNTDFSSMVDADKLKKNHWEQLEIFNPDLIFIDFISEKNDIIISSGEFIEHSKPLIDVIDQINLNYKILSPLDPLISKIRDHCTLDFLRQCYSITNNILIHQAEWATRFTNPSGVIDNFTDPKLLNLISQNNDILSDLFLICRESILPIEFIGGGDFMVASGNNLNDIAPYCYSNQYYEILMKNLLRRY